MASKINPTVMTMPDGYIVETWFEYDSGSSGVGKMWLRYRGPSDAWGAWSTAVTVRNGSSTAYSIADFGWSNVSGAYDEEGRWVTCPILAGNTDPTPLYSCDFGQSWSS